MTNATKQALFECSIASGTLHAIQEVRALNFEQHMLDTLASARQREPGSRDAVKALCAGYTYREMNPTGVWEYFYVLGA